MHRDHHGIIGQPEHFLLPDSVVTVVVENRERLPTDPSDLAVADARPAHEPATISPEEREEELVRPRQRDALVAAHAVDLVRGATPGVEPMSDLLKSRRQRISLG